MILQIRSEFKKLLTIRSTYIFLLVCLAITILFAFYIEGLHLTKAVTDPGKLAGEVRGAANALAFFIALPGLLLVTHEYRYNTIMYTLTSTNNRLKVLLAKIVAVTFFSIIAILFFATLAPLLAAAGVHLKGLAMVHQHIPVLQLLWRTTLFGWGYAMLALVFAYIIRSQVGSIISLLLFPGTVETLLGLLLKSSAAYLPFASLDGVLGQGRGPETALLSPEKSAIVAAIYIAVGLVVSAVLFQKRDAS